MTGATLLHDSTSVAFALLLLSVVLVLVRLIRGPTLADRILALDLITTLSIALIATFAIRTGFTLYLDIAIALGLLGFLSTVALARYLLKQAVTHGENAEEDQ